MNLKFDVDKFLILNEFGKEVKILKEASYEDILMPEVYGVVNSYVISALFPDVSVSKYENARVYSGADYIVVADKVCFEKTFSRDWAKTVPVDSGLFKIQENYLFTKKTKIIGNIGCSISLCGVHDRHWAHFLTQYLPKLYCLSLFDSNNIKFIVVPKYNDLHIEKILTDFLISYPNIKLIELEKGESVLCSSLFKIDNPSYIVEHMNFMSVTDIMIPKLVRNLLSEQLVKKYRSEINERKYIYIARTKNRSLKNGDEVERYFKSIGFEVIQPHLLTFDEKISLFSAAGEVVGSLSSGFTNLIFSLPDTKVLIFSNNSQIFNGFFMNLLRDSTPHIKYVTGVDDSESPNSSYAISLDRIKAAYESLV